MIMVVSCGRDDRTPIPIRNPHHDQHGTPRALTGMADIKQLLRTWAGPVLYPLLYVLVTTMVKAVILGATKKVGFPTMKIIRNQYR